MAYLEKDIFLAKVCGNKDSGPGSGDRIDLAFLDPDVTDNCVIQKRSI
jgi:hypothetical protein